MRWIKWFFNFWEWPYNAYGDFTEYLIMRNALKEPKVIDTINKSGLRINTLLSRVYTVISIDPELTKNPNTIWPAILEKLKPMNLVMADINVSDIVYPRIHRETESDFLIVLAPEFDYLGWKETLAEICKWFGYYIILGTLNNFLISIGINVIGDAYLYMLSTVELLPL